MKKIAIIGGIGSGKSVVSSILRILGYGVYDCDSEAKRIMVDSADVKTAIKNEFPLAYTEEGELDRPALAKIIFNDKTKLSKLNNIVHPAVRKDFSRWAEAQSRDIVFVETAILFESKMDGDVDEIWNVTASEEIRIERVQKRNGFSVEQIKERIAAQSTEIVTDKKVVEINNNGDVSLLSQVQNLVKGSVNVN